MPFGQYKDFKDCINKNRDKQDPEAYCAAIENTIKQRRAKKRNKRSLATRIKPK